jgi:ferric-dicitrate binding protein FerR (iron transport regulator)
MNVNNTIERKICDYFNGKLSATEEAELIQWLQFSEENEAYFRSYKEKIDPQEIEHPLLQSSFSELKNKLLINQEFNTRNSTGIKKLQLSFARIAAMLLVAVITGFSIAYLLIGPSTPKAEVVWFETHVPRGEKSQLILPDGSKVWLNSESDISYPSDFMTGNRVMKLKGEAYFEVAKLDNKLFTVETNNYNIKVLGTKFNVMAYPDFNRTETSLIEGKIEIQKGEQNVQVIPGETFSYANDKYSIKEARVSQTSKWKDDIFDFDRIAFKELIVRMERWYDVDIEIKNPELNGILYSGIFKNEETIWEVLNTFQLTLPIKCSRVGFRKFVIETNKEVQ